MGKFKSKLLIILWVSVALGLRLVGLFLRTGEAVDTYGYYNAAAAQEDDNAAAVQEDGTEGFLEGYAGTLTGSLTGSLTGFSEKALNEDPGDLSEELAEENVPQVLYNSGLVYAYTKKLADIIKLSGLGIEGIAVIQLFLQAVWILIIIFGMELLWGKTAGTVTGCVLAFSPWVMSTCWQISPENFYMLHWALVLLLLSIFYQWTQKHGWYRSNPGELFLIVIGFLMGMICIWNYQSWILAVITVYVLLKNHSTLKEKLWQQQNGEELLEKDQIMPAWTEGFILSMGVLLGMFATLMKYTGLTGYAIGGQFVWWIRQYMSLPGRCQGVDSWLIVWLIAALAAGIIFQQIVNKAAEVRLEKRERAEAELKREEAQRKKQQARKMADTGWESIQERERPAPLVRRQSEPKPGLEPESRFKPESKFEQEPKKEPKKESRVEVGRRIQQADGEYVMTEDGRIVKLLDNPLPVPKKHVKKEITFDHAAVKDDFDFDFDIGADGDFDI